MGYRNVRGVTGWRSQLSAPAYDVLVHLAGFTYDDHGRRPPGRDPRTWWGGHHKLAVWMALVPPSAEPTAANRTRMSRLFAELVKAGAIEKIRPEAPGQSSWWRINLRPDDLNEPWPKP